MVSGAIIINYYNYLTYAGVKHNCCIHLQTKTWYKLLKLGLMVYHVLNTVLAS